MGDLDLPDNSPLPEPTKTDMNVASIIWGLSIAFAIFGAAKGAEQTWGIWKRKRKLTFYVYLIWIEWLVNVLFSPAVWFHLWGTIPPCFALFFTIILLWTFQVQCTIQIMINRVSLLSHNKSMIRKMQWTAFMLIACINVSIFCIWIPAQMRVNQTYVIIDFFWDRIEKVIFAITDCSLNVYFIYLVRSKLIKNGLTKYYPLFYFNCCMIGVSLSLDIILIGMMSVGQGFVYVQFHPMVYAIKLYIEMNLADLIKKAVKNDKPEHHGNGPTNNPSLYYHSSSGAGRNNNSNNKTRNRVSYTAAIGGKQEGGRPGGIEMSTMVTVTAFDGKNNNNKMHGRGGEHGGIHRMTETSVVNERKDDDAASLTSSTEHLQKHHGMV